MRQIYKNSKIHKDRYYMIIATDYSWHYLYGFAVKRFICRDLDPVNQCPSNSYYDSFDNMKKDVIYELSDNENIVCYEFDTKKEALEYRKRRKLSEKLCR